MPSKHSVADSLADIIENAERIESYLVGMVRWSGLFGQFDGPIKLKPTFLVMPPMPLSAASGVWPARAVCGRRAL